MSGSSETIFHTRALSGHEEQCCVTSSNACPLRALQFLLSPPPSAPGRLCGEGWLLPAFRLRIKEDTQAPQRAIPCTTPGPAWTRCLEEPRSTLFPDRPPGRTKDAEQQGWRDDIYSLPGFLIEAPCCLLPSPSCPFLQEAPDYLGVGAIHFQAPPRGPPTSWQQHSLYR